MSFGDFHLNNMSQFSGCRFRFEPTLSSSLPSFGRESPVGGVSLVRERGRIGRDGFGEEVAGCDLNRIFWPLILAYGGAITPSYPIQGCFQTPWGFWGSHLAPPCCGEMRREGAWSGNFEGESSFSRSLLFLRIWKAPSVCPSSFSSRRWHIPKEPEFYFVAKCNLHDKEGTVWEYKTNCPT